MSNTPKSAQPSNPPLIESMSSGLLHTKRIDRIDDNGNIREHVLSVLERNRTRCGLVVYNGQKPAGNRSCKRCAMLLAADLRDALAEVEEHENGGKRRTDDDD